MVWRALRIHGAVQYHTLIALQQYLQTRLMRWLLRLLQLVPYVYAIATTVLAIVTIAPAIVTILVRVTVITQIDA